MRDKGCVDREKPTCLFGKDERGRWKGKATWHIISLVFGFRVEMGRVYIPGQNVALLLSNYSLNASTLT
jgi:hypothetical protein